jgi:hypothetical protein
MPLKVISILQVSFASTITNAPNERGFLNGPPVRESLRLALITELNKAVIYNCYPKNASVALAEFLKPFCHFFIGIEAQKGGGFGMIGGNRIDIKKTCC